jgi:hypothetical protein
MDAKDMDAVLAADVSMMQLHEHGLAFVLVLV